VTDEGLLRRVTNSKSKQLLCCQAVDMQRAACSRTIGISKTWDENKPLICRLAHACAFQKPGLGRHVGPPTPTAWLWAWGYKSKCWRDDQRGTLRVAVLCYYLDTRIWDIRGAVSAEVHVLRCVRETRRICTRPASTNCNAVTTLATSFRISRRYRAIRQVWSVILQ